MAVGTCIPSSQCESGSASAASPTMPFSTPISVMPIWMVERKRLGFWPSATAAAAPRSPSSMWRCIRVLRAVTSEISDIAKSPFNRMSPASSRISMTRVPECGPF